MSLRGSLCSTLALCGLSPAGTGSPQGGMSSSCSDKQWDEREGDRLLGSQSLRGLPSPGRVLAQKRQYGPLIPLLCLLEVCFFSRVLANECTQS
jgi:hypothetical protein